MQLAALAAMLVAHGHLSHLGAAHASATSYAKHGASISAIAVAKTLMRRVARRAMQAKAKVWKLTGLRLSIEVGFKMLMKLFYKNGSATIAPCLDDAATLVISMLPMQNQLR
jgi:hypothetical protein